MNQNKEIYIPSKIKEQEHAHLSIYKENKKPIYQELAISFRRKVGGKNEAKLRKTKNITNIKDEKPCGSRWRQKKYSWMEAKGDGRE